VNAACATSNDGKAQIIVSFPDIKASYDCSTDCATDCDLDNAALVVGTDCVLGESSFYYKIGLTDTSDSAVAQSYYVATYSTSACTDAVYTGQDKLTVGTTVAGYCTTLTSNSAKKGGVTLTFPDYALAYGCTTDCTTSCDATTVALVVDGDCEKGDAVGSTTYYKLSSKSLTPTTTDSDSSSILSFATLALCALFALLF